MSIRLVPFSASAGWMLVFLLMSEAEVQAQALQGLGGLGGFRAGGGQGESADQGGDQRALEIVPRISTDLIWSDNARRRSDGGAEFTTTLSPGVRVAANGRRLKGSLDYGLTRVMRAQNTSGDETQNSLSSAATLEAVENHMFVDFSGSITQRAISAFGQPTDDNFGVNANSTEVRTFRLSPYLRGRLSESSDYMLRYSALSSKAASSAGTNLDSQQLSGSLRSSQQASLFSWSLDASRQKSDYKDGRNLEADQLRSVLGYRVTPEFKLSLIPGWESNNYATSDKESRLTWGVGGDWSTARTKLSAVIERRFFGPSHSLNFEHRTPRTAWKFQDSKNAVVSPEQAGRTSLGPLYDLLFFQFESLEPDPIRRALLVESFLLANGLNGQTPVEVGFLASGARLQRRQDLSFTLTGLRDTLGLIATQSRSSALFNSTSGLGDLSNSSLVRQQSISLNYARRLALGTSLNMLIARLRSVGSLTNQSTTLMTYSIGLSTDLGRQVKGSVGLSRAEFDSPTSPYTENSIRAGVTVRF